MNYNIEIEGSEEVVDQAAEPTTPRNTKPAASGGGSALEQRYSKLLSEESAAPGKLTGMFRGWFLDYASYVILERAVPHLIDGLKPVQRRILHTLKKMDDGRYNKVANVIGFTMQFHPHGDASIGDALVGLGQKDLLIDCQGNWGNYLTGDSAAAPRYIEARLSKFALDVLFNNKITEWTPSYDGRNNEPVTLPVKFPLLLAQGVEGIAVGLASKILPHNFCEILDASIAYLKGEDFELYPDFMTGGLVDVSRYSDGMRGGSVKVRAKITKQDRKTLVITEIPFGKTTTTLIESIIKANDKGKIKIKKVDDNTAAEVSIVIHLANDVSADKTIDALYAFTDCEVSISPNACVIHGDQPHFMGVKAMLMHSVDNTKYLLGRELEIRLGELAEDWHMSSLEKIFIENRIYLSIEQCETWESVLQTIDREITPYKILLRRDVTTEDITKLTEIKIKRISKYDAFKSDEHIRGVEAEMEQVERDLASLTSFAIAYYKNLLKKYGKGKERKTEIRSFDQIQAATVAVANAKLYVDKKEGFFGIGTQMKGAEYVGDCSDIDDVILINKQGQYIITKVVDKGFFTKGIIHCAIFKRGDVRTIYNVIYRDGAAGAIMVKRCAISAITRDKVYEITKGTPKSEVLYLTSNPNGEAEILKIYFKPRPRLKKLIEEFSFGNLAIKGRASQGNLLTRYAIHKIVMKERGVSTLEGQNIWWDADIERLNSEGRGELLGEFKGNDRIIVFTTDNSYYTTNFDVQQHFAGNIERIEKWKEGRTYTVIYFDKELNLHYIKRFTAEISDNKPQSYIELDTQEFVALSSDQFPAVEVVYGGRFSQKPAEVIDAAQFIGIKTHRAKGRRLSNLELSEIRFGEPLQEDEPDAGEVEQEVLESEVENLAVSTDTENLDSKKKESELMETYSEMEEFDDVPDISSGVEPLDSSAKITQGELF